MLDKPFAASVALPVMSSCHEPRHDEDAAPEDQPEQVQVRLDKRQRMLDDGIEPYPAGYPRTHTLAAVRTSWPDLEPDQATGVIVGVTGRVVFVRTGGKLCFATLRSGDGTELQVMLSLDRVGRGRARCLEDVRRHRRPRRRTGEVVSSRRGELSVLADSWAVTAKAVRPLPNLYEGAQLSEDLRARQRYVDLIVRPEARTMARLRPAVVQSLRRTFDERGFIEVETPMLQTLQGGASARPFVTHANAFDLDVFLRIAPELFLKGCVVGGLEQVFEINRNFRNEGADSTHSPEFAMLEAYQAYGDYDTIAVLTRDLIQEAALAAFGTLQVALPDGGTRDLSGSWDQVTLFGSLSEARRRGGHAVHLPRAAARAGRQGRSVGPDDAIPGKLAEELFEHHVVDTFTGPTFVRDFPLDTSPLVRGHRHTPGVVEKWDLYVDGIELATGYTELVDPVVQRERLVEQARLRTGGDVEAMPLDEDFLRAMEHGMPPMGGMGMGVDRLLMALTGLGIRETILFPLVKPEV